MTELLLCYALLLMAAVLISALADRSLLSTSMLFLIGGIAVSPSGLNLIRIPEESDLIRTLAELALFASLFTDGMLMGLSDLRSAWKLPGRALLFGMPLTMLLTAVLGHYLLQLDWTLSFLVGAVLAPTDPVFASAIIGADNIPRRLRDLLHVESGINDGMALPIVVILLAVTTHENANLQSVGLELLGGLLVGIAIPLAAIWLERLSIFESSPAYQPLNAMAIGLLVLATGWQLHVNQFLAAFAAGVTIGTAAPETRDAFNRFGNLVAEMLKLAALLVFGASISRQTLMDISPAGWLFVFLLLILVRSVAIVAALAGSELKWSETLAAAWFGPRGFASVVYGLMILRSGLPRADELFHLIAVVVAVSIVAHSSTDVLVSGWFQSAPDENPPTPDKNQASTAV